MLEGPVPLARGTQGQNEVVAYEWTSWRPPPKEAGGGHPGYIGHWKLQLHSRLSKPSGSRAPAEILASSEPKRTVPEERPIGHLPPPWSNHRRVFWKLPQTQFLCRQAKASGSFQGPAWNPSGRLLLVQGTPCSDRKICALGMLYIILYTPK